MTFALGAAMAGLGGALAVDSLGLDPSFPFKYLIIVLMIVAIGGPGSIAGSLVAALVLGVVDAVFKYEVPTVGPFVIYVLLVGAAAGVPPRAGGAPGMRPASRPVRAVLLLAALAGYCLFPDYLGLLTQIAILATLRPVLRPVAGASPASSRWAMPRSSALGAYTAAIVARAGYTEPVVGLLAAAAVSAAWLALLLPPIVARGNDLTRLLITLGVGSLLVEAANRART